MSLQRKVILDMDPGFGDALALALALASPEVEVVAVTATGGNVTPRDASRNVQAIIEYLDPARRPRIGQALEDQILRTDARQLNGPDGLCGANLDVVELVNQHPALKVLGEEIRRAPYDVTVIATGPLTNIASLLLAEPDIASLIGHLIIAGGTVAKTGNATAAAEFNFYCDAEAARNVLRSPVTKTLIPLDVSGQLVLGFEFLELVKQSKSRTASLLERILPGAYRMSRQWLGVEGIHIYDVMAVIAAIRPNLFTTTGMYGDVETVGELTQGACVVDRRPTSTERPNMDVAIEIETSAVEAYLYRLLENAP